MTEILNIVQYLWEQFEGCSLGELPRQAQISKKSVYASIFQSMFYDILND